MHCTRALTQYQTLNVIYLISFFVLQKLYDKNFHHI